MGKLHTIKRAIKRNPHDWYEVYSNGRVSVNGASYWRGEWQSLSHYYGDSSSYKDFVKSVLIEEGYIKKIKSGGMEVLIKDGA